MGDETAPEADPNRPESDTRTEMSAEVPPSLDFPVVGAEGIARSPMPEVHEDELQRTRWQLHGSLTGKEELRSVLRLVVEQTQDCAIVTLDVAGLVTSWNQGATRMFGFRESEMLGRPIDILFTPEDRAANAPQLEMRRARESGRAESCDETGAGDSGAARSQYRISLRSRPVRRQGKWARRR